MFSFGKKKTPDEQAKEWKKKLKSEIRGLDRQIRHIEREEAKVKTKIKQLAKKGEIGAVKILAKEIVTTRKTKDRMHTAKAQMNSVSMQLTTTSAMGKMTEVMGRSTQVLSAMNTLMNVPEVSATMRTMAMEMEKAGVMEEMVDDAMAMTEDYDLDDLADEEVSKVITELTDGLFAGVASPTTALPTKEAVVEEEVDKLAAMKARLEAL